MNRMKNRHRAGFVALGLLAAIVSIALLGGCKAAVEESEAWQGGNASSPQAPVTPTLPPGIGLARLAISNGDMARTLMPVDPTTATAPTDGTSIHPFIRYNLLFTPTTGTAIKVSATPEEYIDVELVAAGSPYRVEVYAYTLFDLTSSGSVQTNNPFLAAYGAAATVAVADGMVIDVSIDINVLPLAGLAAVTPTPTAAPTWWGDGAYANWETLPTTLADAATTPTGIFNYWISYPQGLKDGVGLGPTAGSDAEKEMAMIELKKVGSDGEDKTLYLPLTSGTGMVAGAWTEVPVVPGYYDMFITLKKKSDNLQEIVYTMAGVYSAVHIYAGMETKTPQYTFNLDTDFMPTVNLAGTVLLGIPSGVTLSELKVIAYMDEACTVPILGGDALTTTALDDALAAHWTTTSTLDTTETFNWLLTVPYFQTQYDSYAITSPVAATLDGVHLKITVKRSAHPNPDPYQYAAWTGTRETITRIPKSFTANDIPESGRSGIALTLNIAGMHVVFNGLPVDETWDLTRDDSGALYWDDRADDVTDGTHMEISLTGGSPSGTVYKWYVDNNSTAISTAAPPLEIHAQQFREGKHTITCRVIPAGGTPPYSKMLAFTVVRQRP